MRRHRARRARAAGRPHRKVKISAVIIRMIEPYAPDDLGFDEYRVLIAVCKAAWNLTVLEQFADCTLPKVRDAIERVREIAAGIGRPALLDELQQRKISLFPDDRRFIVNVTVEPLESGSRYVTAASIVFDPTPDSGGLP